VIKKDSIHVLQVELYDADVSSETSVKSMIKNCVKVYGRLDIACNNAGIASASARTSDISPKDYDRVCAVNERGVSVPI
jgi:NAD(P)-dependent dehydrogenase (short-subunit alcohol dehydrogenase family)